MLQDIHPHKYAVQYKPKDPRQSDCVLVVQGTAILRNPNHPAEILPTLHALRDVYDINNEELAYLFSVDDTRFFLYPKTPDEKEYFQYQDPQTFRDFQPSFLAFAGITAWHLGQWYAKHRHCGACGTLTTHKADERALVCPACGLVVYPTISPAVIVAVTDGDRLLLTRYSDRPNRRQALIAGFMEIGETFEDTIRREVMEEVGLTAKNLRYYKSQPWAFSGSVLTGFFAELDGSPEVTLDTTELKEAIWVNRKDIPPDPGNISLTAEMIDVFRRGGPAQ